MSDLENSKVPDLNIKDLAKAGVAYGYSKSKRNPSTKSFIYSTQNGVDLIKLEDTKKQILESIEFLKTVKESGKKILFIGEKPEISKLVKEIALSIDQVYVTNRFIGGTLTNFPQIKKRVDKLHKMLEDKDKGEWAKFTKKEQVLKQRELDKLDKNFGGLGEFKNLPGAVVVVDSKYEVIPVKEAQISKIPVVAISNTDCNISKIEYPIIANDSSKSSVNFILNLIKDSLK